MAKRTIDRAVEPEATTRSDTARIAFDSVVESIHEDHRMLEGQELWQAVVEVFGLTRPPKPQGDTK